MALSDAVMDIVKEMEDVDWDSSSSSVNGALIVVFIRQLRTAVKAASAPAIVPVALPYPNYDAAVQQRHIEERKRQELVERGRKEEGTAASMTDIVGGKSNGDMVSVDTTMPTNAHTLIAGEVYTLKEDGRLHFNEEQTKKMKR